MPVQLVIAEVVGKTSEADRSNRYVVARGDAMECGAIVDVVRLPGTVETAELDVPMIVDEHVHVTRDT